MEVCIMTFDQQMQFYQMAQDANADPTILVVADVDDPFAPGPRERLMLNIKEDRDLIDALLDKLVTLYNIESRKNLPIQICSGAAMFAGKDLLAKRGGKVLLFASNFCSIGAGKLKSRIVAKEVNTDAEKKLFQHTPEHSYFANLGKQGVKERVIFDIF